MSKAHKYILIVGPTATGKSELVSQLASLYPIEVIGLDSVQVYKGLDIGSAKVSREVQEKIPHHLIDVVAPNQLFTVADYISMAKKKIKEIRKRGNIPIMVGGTMMYAHMFLQGGLKLPEANNNLRDHLQDRLDKEGRSVLINELKEVDPEIFNLDPSMTNRRLIRHYEIFLNTGLKPSALRNEEQAPSDFEATQVQLWVNDREKLREKIALRFKKMLADGFLHEVDGLIKKYPDAVMMPSMKSIGYQQAIEYRLSHKYTYDDFVERSIIATRQYAKKQMTWLKQWKYPVDLIIPVESESRKKLEQIVQVIEKIL